VQVYPGDILAVWIVAHWQHAVSAGECLRYCMHCSLRCLCCACVRACVCVCSSDEHVAVVFAMHAYSRLLRSWFASELIHPFRPMWHLPAC
jgi:hypothetical protein